MDPRMNGSVTGNCSAALSVVGKSGHNVKAIKRNGRPPTDNATTHTPTRGNHRPHRHTSNSPRLPGHHSANPYHHVHYRCFSSLHARTSRVRHCTPLLTWLFQMIALVILYNVSKPITASYFATIPWAYPLIFLLIAIGPTIKVVMNTVNALEGKNTSRHLQTN